MLFQGCPLDSAVLNEPQLCLWIPCSLGGPGLVLELGFRISDTYRNQFLITIAWSRGCPWFLFNDQFNGFDSCAGRFVIAVANTEQGIAVFSHQFLSSFLSRQKF